MIYPRRISNADSTPQAPGGAPLTGYGGPQRVYGNGAGAPQPYSYGATPRRHGPVDEDGNVDSDFSSSGYDRMYRAPSKAETPGNMLSPVLNPAPATGDRVQSEAPADPSHFSWNGSPYAGGGQSGSPTQFGNNFIGMQAYLNGNRSPGLANQSFDQFAAGPSGSYSKNMNALDSSLYGFYGVKDTRPQATGAAVGALPGSDATPQAAAAGAPGMANAAGEAQDANFDAMKRGMSGNRQRD